MVDVLQQMIDDGDATVGEIAVWIGIPEETLTEIETRARLSVRASEKLRRLAEMIGAANRAFGDRSRAYTWLRRKNTALGGLVPAHLVATDEGFTQVELVLGRIEYGAVS